MIKTLADLFIQLGRNEAAGRRPAQPEILKDFRTMRLIDVRMCNLDSQIDEDMGEKLRAKPGKVYGSHTAWNFHGYVWFECGLFHEQVWVHNVPQKELSAPTLRELMSLVNSEFGAD